MINIGSKAFDQGTLELSSPSSLVDIQNPIVNITSLNPSEIIDRSTFDDPHQLSKGMIHVLVNGEPVILNEVSTRAMPGRVIRRMA